MTLRLAREIVPAACLILLLTFPPASAERTRIGSAGMEAHSIDQDSEEEIRALLELDIEELLAIQLTEVTSVAGVNQSQFETPSAVYVLDGESIRRAGHKSVAEALRMVPGLNAARLTSHNWAISSRGFGGTYSNKLLVMIDGRSVYTPLFAGVYWDVQDLDLEDIERIEVIRGPGATLWGANAVNGVINIITKCAADTQGGYASAGAGSFERGFTDLRYGGRLDEDTHFRVFGGYADRASGVDIAGESLHNDWALARAGLRVDGASDSRSWSLLGGTHSAPRLGTANLYPIPELPLVQSVQAHETSSGANLLFRMEEGDEAGGWRLQTYFDRTERVLPEVYGEKRNTWDLDYRRHVSIGTRQTLVYGLGYRLTRDEIASTFVLSFADERRGASTIALFAQDNVSLPGGLSLIAGSKLERNDYTGLEVQPGLRLSWSMSEKSMFWGSLARAVRVPDRVESDGTLTVAVIPGEGGAFIPIQGIGSKDIRSEVLLAAELGYRTIPRQGLSLDLTVFRNSYSDLLDFLNRTEPNAGSGTSVGFELAANWLVTSAWQLMLGYAALKIDLDSTSLIHERSAPRNQATLRSYLDLSSELELNGALYYVDEVTGKSAPAYIRADLGLTWHMSSSLDLAVWGQNLLAARHLEGFEAEAGYGEPTSIPRGVYLQLKRGF